MSWPFENKFVFYLQIKKTIRFCTLYTLQIEIKTEMPKKKIEKRKNEISDS